MQKVMNGILIGLWIAILILGYVLLKQDDPIVWENQEPCIECESLDDGWPVLNPVVEREPAIKNVER